MSADLTKSGIMGKVHWALLGKAMSDLRRGHLLEQFPSVTIGLCDNDIVSDGIYFYTFWWDPILLLGF